MEKVVHFKKGEKIIAKGVIITNKDKKIVEDLVTLFYQTDFSLEGIVICSINQRIKFDSMVERGYDIARHIMEKDVLFYYFKDTSMEPSGNELETGDNVITFINQINSECENPNEFSRCRVYYICNKTTGKIQRKEKESMVFYSFQGINDGLDMDKPNETIEISDILYKPAACNNISPQDQQIAERFSDELTV